jgi:hypothetical protein
MPSERRIAQADPNFSTYGVWEDDPRRLILTLSRYKFVAKVLAGRVHVLEVGGDAFATRLVQQEVQYLTAIDFDQSAVDAVLSRSRPTACWLSDPLRWSRRARRHPQATVAA